MVSSSTPNTYSLFLRSHGKHSVPMVTTGLCGARAPPEMMWLSALGNRAFLSHRHGLTEIARYDNPSASHQDSIHPKTCSSVLSCTYVHTCPSCNHSALKRGSGSCTWPVGACSGPGLGQAARERGVGLSLGLPRGPEGIPRKCLA